MDETNLNLHQRLAKIRKMTEVIQKNKKGFNYKYTSIDEILARVTAGMNKYGVSLIPKITPGTELVTPFHYEKVKFMKDGTKYEEPINEVITQACITYVWVNDDDPADCIEVPWFIVGSQQDPAQALGSGLTYGLRQFMLQFFQIATLDDSDPDNWRSKQREAEEAEARMIAERTIEEVHELVTNHLAAHPDDRQKIIDITKKYAKEKGKPSSNYFNITSPDVAAELLAAIREGIGSQVES
mgnify:CR=1 FL=1